MSNFRPYLGFWLYTLPGDNEHLYRAVPARDEALLKIAEKLAGFQPYERTSETMAVGPHPRCSVIRIPRLPFQVRIQELTRASAMRVVLFLIDMAIACHKEKYTLWDIHEGNVLWWNGPRFVDFDALRPLTHANAALSFVRIGYLMYRYVFRRALTAHDKFDFAALAREGGWMADQIHRKDFTDPGLWRDLRAVLGNVKPPAPPTTHWSSEYATSDLASLAKNPKIAKVLDMAPAGRTLLDVGCNKGYCARLLRDRYEHILGFDSDEASIDAASTAAPVNMNFACFGLQHLDRAEPIPIHERFHADVVLALAITHHLRDAGLSSASVAASLAKLTRRHLLLEDIVDVGTYHAALRKHGLSVTAHVPSYPSGRMLTLWSR